MKKRKIFKTPMLFSQEEMAMLLGITRSQWAMFEIGQRDIPSSAKLKLATLIKGVNVLSKVATKELPHHKIQQSKKEEILYTQLKENRLQQLIIERKLAKLKKNYQEAENTLQFVALLKGNKNITVREEAVLNVVQAKALVVLDRNGLHLQLEQQLRLSTLDAQTKFIEREMGE
ncbi:hypothetical protein SY27_13750 [Flavobacterium sp. 316]|uniref:Helix-turn-helix domain-containing protein n=1 Tax=Flavobacterium sediminilitoris TaxID=2024526 RepID=A0ABY4HKJ8_9FLAO|nr:MULTISPECIES: hypothetical protein [Flavobacterium]KIX20205.1 hypothetical protein SY27_13750 [Flavobacterium sp. 316]UOX33098.1 helix-turn-helix domain-containing protein [Flavobacterium sediminilitoris]